MFVPTCGQQDHAYVLVIACACAVQAQYMRTCVYMCVQVHDVLLKHFTTIRAAFIYYSSYCGSVGMLIQIIKTGILSCPFSLRRYFTLQ